jgi:hypothetical protein
MDSAANVAKAPGRMVNSYLNWAGGSQQKSQQMPQQMPQQTPVPQQQQVQQPPQVPQPSWKDTTRSVTNTMSNAIRGFYNHADNTGTNNFGSALRNVMAR